MSPGLHCLREVGAPQLPAPWREVEGCWGQPPQATRRTVPEPLHVEMRHLM